MLFRSKNEEEDNTVSVREREEGDLGSMLIEEFIRRIAHENDNSSAG